MSKTNDNKQPVAVGSKQPQAAPPTNEVFIRVGTTLYKVVDQPTITEGTEKVPFFYDQNGKCLRFVTSLSANRLK